MYEGGRPPVPATFTASLVAFGDKLLPTSEDGDTFVIKAGPTHEILRTNSVGEPVYASLALAGGTIYIRGEQHLFAIRSEQMNSPSTMAGRAPDLVPEQIEVGTFDRDAFADADVASDARRVAQIVERHLEDLFHFPRRGDELRPRVGDADDRMQREAADHHVHRRQLAEHAHRRRIDADFLGGFAQRRLGERFARVGRAARQADLAGVPASPLARTVSGTATPLSRGIDQQQRRRRAGVGRKMPGAPARPRRRRRELQLRLDAGERLGQPDPQRALELAQ